MDERRTPRSQMRSLGSLVIGALAIACAARSAHAGDVVLGRDESGSPLARRAVQLCLDAVEVDDPARRADMLERGLAVAERAVTEDETDAKAHFAVFCNLGRKLEDGGVSLAGLANVQRLQREIDRALELAPKFVDAMAAKGAFLVALPALLGGDADAGERLLRQAVALAPGHAPARLELVKALLEKGDKEQARVEARAVLTIAEAAVEVRTARELAAKLGS